MRTGAYDRKSRVCVSDRAAATRLGLNIHFDLMHGKEAATHDPEEAPQPPKEDVGTQENKDRPHDEDMQQVEPGAAAPREAPPAMHQRILKPSGMF